MGPDAETRALTVEELQAVFDRDFRMRRVNEDLVIFDATNSSIALWRAYRRIRAAGEPVPDEVLQRIDSLAELTLKRGGAPLTPKEDSHRYRVAARTIKTLARYDALAALHAGRRPRPRAWLCRIVAQDLGLTFYAVERLVRRYRNAVHASAAPKRRRSVFDV